jgi:hypothetical protein
VRDDDDIDEEIKATPVEELAREDLNQAYRLAVYHLPDVETEEEEAELNARLAEIDRIAVAENLDEE